jgi:Tfp pilus assembly protein PilE
MKKFAGFSLIELIIFIVVTSLLASTILLSFRNLLIQIPTIHNNYIASQFARTCMEGIIAQKKIAGLASLACPSTTVPVYCTAATGFVLAVNFACTTINTDATYETATVTVSGLGNDSLTTLLASY